MKTNSAGFELIKGFEGLRLRAYLCPAGRWTIGYGHISADVHEGQRITAAQAESLLESDLAKVAKGVEKLVAGIAATENQFSALVSFAYNVGLGNLRRSTLLKKLLGGDAAGAAAEFAKWTKARDAKGKLRELPGLVRRRRAERDLFERPA